MKLCLSRHSRITYAGRILLILFLAGTFFSCKNETETNGAPLGASNSERSTGFEESNEENPESIRKLGSAEGISAAISAGSLNLFQKDSVSAFYKKRNNAPAWDNPSLRASLIDTLRSAGAQGLYFEDYHGEEIIERNKKIRELDNRGLSEFDILLTDAFLKFGDHLLNGKVDPGNIHKIWDTPKNKANKLQILEETINEKSLEVALNRLRPLHPMYNDLIASSKEYEKLKENYDRLEKIEKGGLIKSGMEDERLPKIRSRLKLLGHLKSNDTTSTKHTEEVQQAVKKFQEENGVQIDGIIGNNTIELLNKGYNTRYEQILVNLERWRWYPRDLGHHYFIINISNFWLHVVENEDTVSVHKTMVGVEGRRTPVFSDQIEYVVFNPTWTIPPTIRNEDVIPGMQNNKNYLANRNINIFNQDGEQVDPSEIDWSGEEPKEYIYRQGPGPENPLGRVKIMYPNKYLIYLHDTPSQALFEQNVRAESSGCVRVENAVDLAKYLLSDQEHISPQDIDTFISRGNTKRVNIDQEVKVHHFYWTSWRENGETRFTTDIYNYDGKTYEALKNAS